MSIYDFLALNAYVLHKYTGVKKRGHIRGIFAELKFLGNSLV